MCEHLAHVDDVPEIGALVAKYLPLDKLSDTTCRAVADAALRAHAEGRTLAETLREMEDSSGELQAFAAEIQMAPSKVIGEELSRADAVRSLILRIWERNLRAQRDTLTPEDTPRRAQLTYDLKALRDWEDGSAVIELEMSN